MAMELEQIYQKALALTPLSRDEGVALWYSAPLDELMATAHQVRLLHNPEPVVTWQIDRNINITNVCSSACLFCSFHAGAGVLKPFTTTLEEYRSKIGELLALGGDQVLLQGGLHPKYGLDFYTDLFRALKTEFPSVKLHALGPAEVLHIARLEGISIESTLLALRRAGLDSLPGAGAEILVQRVRDVVSPRKASVDEWVEVMRIAHRLGLLTSATMMYGQVETVEERIQHLLVIRDLQDAKPERSVGFLAFIPWPCMLGNTKLQGRSDVQPATGVEHLRMVAIARLMLHNIRHVQASWLTVGRDIGTLSLWAGADDMGSIMIEENVVASAGAQNRMDAEGMQGAIRAAGFTPQLRDQGYHWRENRQGERNGRKS